MDIRASILQSGNDAYDDIVDSLEEIFYLVNSEVGWTVYGWVKRFLISDVSPLGDYTKGPGDNKVLSQEVSTRVVHLHSSKKDCLNHSKIHGRSLENLKFDLSTL